MLPRSDRTRVGSVYFDRAPKTSPTRYGIDASGRNVAMSGWDSSCVTHAVLIRQSDIEERSPSGRVVKTRKGTTEVPALTLVAKGA